MVILVNAQKAFDKIQIFHDKKKKPLIKNSNRKTHSSMMKD